MVNLGPLSDDYPVNGSDYFEYEGFRYYLIDGELFKSGMTREGNLVTLHLGMDPVEDKVEKAKILLRWQTHDDR